MLSEVNRDRSPRPDNIAARAPTLVCEPRSCRRRALQNIPEEIVEISLIVSWRQFVGPVVAPHGGCVDHTLRSPCTRCLHPPRLPSSKAAGKGRRDVDQEMNVVTTGVLPRPHKCQRDPMTPEPIPRSLQKPGCRCQCRGHAGGGPVDRNVAVQRPAQAKGFPSAFGHRFALASRQFGGNTVCWASRPAPARTARAR